jgi:hypothetical protein
LRKIIALFAGLSLATSATGQTGPKFSTTGGVGSSTSTYVGGEPNGGTYTINGTTGVVSTPVVNLRPGSAPASPQNGDCWTTIAGLFCRINGATVGPYGAAGGTVTQVGLVPPSIFTAGAPVTTNGNLSFTLNSQSANQVFAGPNGSSGTPGFRALALPDLPNFQAPVSGSVARAINSKLADVSDVRDFGATCNGLNAVDDAPAFQAAINAVPNGATITFPGGCYLASTVNVTKSVTIQGQGPNSQLYIPAVNGFNVTASAVTFRDVLLKGNNSSSSANIGIYMSNNSAYQTYDNINCENMNGCVAVAGGFYHQASTFRARNCVQYCIRLMNQTSQASSSPQGVEFVLRGFQYDSDGTMPTIAAVWVQDFDGLVMSDFDIIHGGQIANLYINPQYTRSGDHLISRGYLDINTTGDGVRVNPTGTAKSDRVSFVGTWMATQVNGVHFTGANQIEGYAFVGGLIYNQHHHGFLDDNTYGAFTTTTIRNMQFSANGTDAASTYSDINLASTGANRLYSINSNVFNNSMGNTTPLYNINLGSNVEAQLVGNDVKFSSASGTKINGLDLNKRTSPDSFATMTIASSGSATLAAQSGLLALNDPGSGNTCLFLLGGNSTVLVSQSVGTSCAASATPTTSQIGVAYSSGSYKIFNGFAASKTITALINPIRAAN